MRDNEIDLPQLVRFLKLERNYGGNATKAGRELGVIGSTARTWRAYASTHGITADTPIESKTDKLAALQTRVKLLTKQLSAAQTEADTAESIRKTIYNLAEQTPDPPEWIETKPGKGGSGVPVLFLSDFHWGERVSKTETGGANKYDSAIASSRFASLIASVDDLCFHHMTHPEYPGIVVPMGGDMLCGNIHEELMDTSDAYLQQALFDVKNHLIMGLTHFADKFGKVFVPCVVGNHGRMTLKPRCKGRVYTSFEWNLYCQLEQYFQAKDDKRIQFLIPGETDAHFSVNGHRFLLTHGDALGVKGGDGIIGALGPIARGAIKVRTSEAQIGRDFDTLLLAHWHTYIPRGAATPVIVNGTLKGYDEYARLQLRANYSRPSQALFFVHPKHGITAQWQVYVDKGETKTAGEPWIKWRE